MVLYKNDNFIFKEPNARFIRKNYSTTDKMIIDAVDYIDKKVQVSVLIKEQTEINMKEKGFDSEKYKSNLELKEKFIMKGKKPPKKLQSNIKEYENALEEISKQTKIDILSSKDVKESFSERGSFNLVLQPNWYYCLWFALYDGVVLDFFDRKHRDLIKNDKMRRMLHKDSMFSYICLCYTLKITDTTWKDKIPEIMHVLDYYGFEKNNTNLRWMAETIKDLIFEKYLFSCEKARFPVNTLFAFINGEINLGDFKKKCLSTFGPKHMIQYYNKNEQAKYYGLRKGQNPEDIMEDKRDVDYLLYTDIDTIISAEKEMNKSNKLTVIGDYSSDKGSPKDLNHRSILQRIFSNPSTFNETLNKNAKKEIPEEFHDPFEQDTDDEMLF